MLGATTLTVALLVDNVANGAARPLFGWISDMIGRENTMAIAFGLGGLSLLAAGAAGTQPWTFVICAGLIFLTWGEIFSLFPSTCTDTFGRNSRPPISASSTRPRRLGLSGAMGQPAHRQRPNLGLHLHRHGVMNFIVVALALFVLKPMRAHYMQVGQPPLGRLKRAPYFMGALGAVVVAWLRCR